MTAPKLTFPTAGTLDGTAERGENGNSCGVLAKARNSSLRGLTRTARSAPVLVIAARPEDETLGCGGSIALHRKAGRPVHILFLTTGTEDERHRRTPRPGAGRDYEAWTALGVIGVDPACVTSLWINTGQLDPTNPWQLAGTVAILRALQPGLAYIPHRDGHSHDHRAAAELCWRAITTAAQPDAGHTTLVPARHHPAHQVPTVLGYETSEPIPAPTYIEDVTTVADQKTEALACYLAARTATPARSDSAGTAGRGERPHAAPSPVWRGHPSLGPHHEAFTVQRLGHLPTL